MIEDPRGDGSTNKLRGRDPSRHTVTIAAALQELCSLAGSMNGIKDSSDFGNMQQRISILNWQHQIEFRPALLHISSAQLPAMLLNNSVAN